MSTSPAKRRRSNSSSAIAVDASNADQGDLHNAAKQLPLNRASFQSPTKASLARSHPDVLSRALSRSAAQRARRSASQGRVRESADENNGESVRGLSDGSTQPDTTTDPMLTSKLQVASADPSSRESLEARSLSANRLPHRPRASGESQDPGLRASPPATGDPEPGNDVLREDAQAVQLSHGDGNEGPPSPNENFGEPELPPTPTELGLEKLATRSKGPLNSSPSLQHELRKGKWRKAREGLNTSPLKHKGGRPPREIVKDAPQPPESKPTNARIPDEVRNKQRLRDKLATQLERLQSELSELEYEARRAERPHDYPNPSDEYANRLIELLVSTNPSCAPPKPDRPPSISSVLSFLLPFAAHRFTPTTEPEPPPSLPSPNPFALEQLSSPAPYLTLFAPLSLAASTTTVSSPVASSSTKDLPTFTQKHELTLCAPPEFPASTYQVPVEVYTDPDKHCVISISVIEPTSSPLVENGSFSIPESLKYWMDSRLSKPRLKLDISGLCWGVCRYWEAAVSRAKVWVKLQSLLSGMLNGTHSPRRSKHLQSGDDEVEPSPRALCPHLGRSYFLFSFPEPSQQPQLLVTCALSLDIWTSEPHLQPDVCVNRHQGARHKGDQVEREARRVLWSVLKNYGEIDTDGLMQAIEAVVSVVFEME